MATIVAINLFSDRATIGDHMETAMNRFLACSAGVLCGARALNNPSFASYGRNLGYENAQSAGASQKGPQGRG